MVFYWLFEGKIYYNIYTFTGRGFPRPVRHERGEGEGEGLPNKDGLLSPTLSSIVPLEEREQAPCAFKEEFCLTPFSAGSGKFHAR
jgi:hypothetical protein